MTPLHLPPEILKILDEVDRPGEICAHGDRPLVMPGLLVNHLGEVSLPLGETQARKLIKLCQQAPYGKGTETVVDTDVRRVWELDPDQFTLSNPEWSGLITEIIEELQCKLGLEDSRLEAHLYKLLLYEKGSFFLPHRDGEKLDRMVATLVVGLPATHQGGELIVSHDKQHHKIMFAGAASGYKLSFAAFDLGDGNPSEEEFEGYTGNAGMTLERWYHRAAIIIWPRKKHFLVLCSAGTDAAVGGLRTMVKQLQRSAPTEENKLYKDCVYFAEKIIDSWQTATCDSGETGGNNNRSHFLPMLMELGNSGLVRRFVFEVMPEDVEARFDKSFCRFCGRHGWLHVVGNSNSTHTKLLKNRKTTGGLIN